MKKFKSLIALATLVFALTLSACAVEYADGTTDYSFSLSEYSVVVEVGETHKLEATYGTYTVEFASLDESVATVSDEGLITAKKEGVTYITVSANGKRESCVVTVEDPVYAITLNANDKIALCGAKLTVKATLLRDGVGYDGAKVTWSLNSSAATLSVDGEEAVFVADKEGVYTVSATDKKGNTASFEIKVMKLGATALSAPVLSVSGRTVSWAAVDGATEYLVGLGDGKFVTVTENSYTVDGTEAVTVYVIAQAGASYDYFNSDASSIAVN